MGAGAVRRRAGRAAARSAVVLAACVAAAGIGIAGGTATAVPATSLIASAKLPSFYRVPSTLPSTRPGTLIKDEKVDVAGIDGTAYRIMYVSTTAANKPVAVTGLVFVPERAAPPGGYPVVTWAHGTNGMAQSCAPSLDPGSAVPLIDSLLSQDWEVTASDYQGEGTPGLLPYLVGSVAARDTIDIVRAAGHLAVAKASTDYVVWGHSEGGQTALFSLSMAAKYAPDLHLKGVVAGAPPSQFSTLYPVLAISPYRYYLFMLADGFHLAYGNKAPLSELLTARGMSLLPVLGQGCSDAVATRVDAYSTTQLLKANPFSLPKWKALLQQNDPESITRASTAPLLIIQGGADEVIPAASTQVLAAHLCSIGQDVERWVYPGQSHSGVVGPSSTDMAHWIADRFADQPNPDPYPPFGLVGIQTSSCPS